MIWSFHMPLFFIISGYMYKECNISNIIHNGLKKLIYPYFVFGIIAVIIDILKYERSLQDAIYCKFITKIQ